MLTRMMSVGKTVLVFGANDPSAPRSVQLPCGQFPSSPAAGKQSPKKFKHSKNKKPAAATILLIIYLLNTNTKGLKKNYKYKKFPSKKPRIDFSPPSVSLSVLLWNILGNVIVCQLIFVVHILNSLLLISYIYVFILSTFSSLHVFISIYNLFLKSLNQMYECFCIDD